MKWLVLDMLIPAGKKTFISAGNYIAGSTPELPSFSPNSASSLIGCIAK